MVHVLSPLPGGLSAAALHVAPRAPFGCETHFALAERAAHIGYWRQEIGPNPPFWSPGFFALMGLDPATTRPSMVHLMERIHPDDRLTVRKALAAAEATGLPFQFRVRTWDLSGPQRLIDTHGEVELGADGRCFALLGVIRDVTMEVEVQRQLRDTEETYRLIMEEATDMITRHDRTGAAIYVSPAVKQILGYQAQDIIGQRSIDFAHPDDIAGVVAAFREAQGKGEVAAFEHRRRHRDGHYVWLESRVRFLINAYSGEQEGAIAISREIGRRKAFEQDLLAARERAEQANHIKSRFLANMSHELRTPLNAIIGFSDIMVREMFGPIGNKHYAEYIQIVNDSGALLLDLINDVLDMSRIEAGKYRLNAERIDVRAPVDAVVQMLSNGITEKRLHVETRGPAAALWAEVDRRALLQILLNLLSNAIKFTMPDGRIEVGVKGTARDVMLWVSDTGVGIPPEFLSRVAQPFEQASSELARVHGGSGLGLALVKSLVSLHGGTFAIASVLGEGTRVTITLPLHQDVTRTGEANCPAGPHS